jgi:hypothetical protein
LGFEIVFGMRDRICQATSLVSIASERTTFIRWVRVPTPMRGYGAPIR